MLIFRRNYCEDINKVMLRWGGMAETNVFERYSFHSVVAVFITATQIITLCCAQLSVS